MKISDNELREKLLDFIKGKTDVQTYMITSYGNTWASDSKVKDVLRSLQEGGLVTSRKIGDTKNARIFWSHVPVKQDQKEIKMALQELPETLAKAARQDELNNILKHEFNIILRKQQRRREWAGKIMQNAEAVIKDLEDKIRWL